MPGTDTFVMHAQHRNARAEHQRWLEDIARWREEHRQAAAMLAAAATAWRETADALEAHAQRIEAHEKHLCRHEQMFQDRHWAVEDGANDPLLSEHQEFERGCAEARKSHAALEHLFRGVMAEALELTKLTRPDAVVLETMA